MTLRISLLLSLLLIFAGCGRYGSPDINLKRKISENEIIGTWTLKPETLVIAKRDGYQSVAGESYEITFRKDGTCDFHSISPFSDESRLDGKGSWKLGHDVGEKKIKNEIMIEIGKHHIDLRLTDEQGKLILWSTWGDPDSWEFIKYEKKP